MTPLLSIPIPNKTKEPIYVALNEVNSFFADVEMVQSTMVQLFGITYEGTQT